MTTLHCSFCGKSQHDVGTLIKGPADHTICDECVLLCVEVIFEDRRTLDHPTRKAALKVPVEREGAT